MLKLFELLRSIFRLIIRGRWISDEENTKKAKRIVRKYRNTK